MTTFLIALTGFISMASSLFSLELPKTWEKDFTIDVSYHGSMSGGRTSIKFTYDSCIYITDSNQAPKKTRAYLLTQKDRDAILGKLRSLKIDKIDTKKEFVAVHDGWSQSICFGFHCIEGGTSVELTDEDKSTFLTAYAFLEQFAIDNTKKVKTKVK
ncbi:MAG: hypothetical protein HOP08_19765 [Cyclobacteriaceae bacterium]|nr:hypothetical protein [Cyclobacteriaceae bacterium]